jgi:CO/xanthine dehydrogenase Mo-binding subunit
VGVCQTSLGADAVARSVKRAVGSRGPASAGHDTSSAVADFAEALLSLASLFHRFGLGEVGKDAKVAFP